MVCDVPGWSAPHELFESPSPIPYAALRYLGCRYRRRYSAGIFDIGTLADLSNIGTLFAFALVAASVLILRKTQPERQRAFKVPFVPLVPILSILTCLLLMASLTLENWVRFFVWLFIGLVVYFAYSRHRSKLNPTTTV